MAGQIPQEATIKKRWLEIFQLTMSNDEVIWIIHKPIHTTSSPNAPEALLISMASQKKKKDTRLSGRKDRARGMLACCSNMSRPSYCQCSPRELQV